jgi:hypothetical protein
MEGGDEEDIKVAPATLKPLKTEHTSWVPGAKKNQHEDQH